MNIYEAEIMAGLSHQLSAQSSIVYASLAEKCEISSNHSFAAQIKNQKSLANIKDSDLYYTQSILVTTSWNKNDDIFDPKEVWLAKNTPEDKPTNLEHDEKNIVGHITSNWPIDENGNIIDENIDINSLPEKYHIVTGSVIYNGYTEEELKARSSKLIQEIEDGNKYVSMECFFKNFDYGLVDKVNGSYHILPRNEETAFLTKHLRAYGGMGEHQNYKIGRVLRAITFSGKGFVDKPANPESIIFNTNFIKSENFPEKNADSEKEGVFSNQANLKETIMNSETQVPQAEEKDVETVVEPTVVPESVVEETVDHEQAAKKMAEEMSKKELEMKKKEEEMKKMKASIESLTKELSVANDTIAAYKNKEEEMMKKDKKAKRLASLISSGLDSAVAETTVDKFESLDDETFEAVTALVASKQTVETETVAEEKTDESVLETAEVEETVNLSLSSEEEDSEIKNTRAALVDFVCIRLGKNLQKGE
jgi:hypothetical protein